MRERDRERQRERERDRERETETERERERENFRIVQPNLMQIVLPFLFPFEGFPKLSTSYWPGLLSNMTTTSQKMITTHLTYAMVTKAILVYPFRKEEFWDFECFQSLSSPIQPKMDPNV